MKIKALLTSAVTIALCLTVIAGSTFALFTETKTVKMTITAGALDITAYADDESVMVRSAGDAGFVAGTNFDNGGKVQISNITPENPYNVAVSGMTPGDAFQFDIKTTNSSEFAIDYTIDWKSILDPKTLKEDQKDLLDALVITIVPEDGYTAAAGQTGKFTVTVEFKDTADNDLYQGAISQIAFTVTAVQHVETTNP